MNTGSALRKTSGSGSAKHECRSTALVFFQHMSLELIIFLNVTVLVKKHLMYEVVPLTCWVSQQRGWPEPSVGGEQQHQQHSLPTQDGLRPQAVLHLPPGQTGGQASLQPTGLRGVLYRVKYLALKCFWTSSFEILKWQSHEIFLHFFQKSSPPGPLINRLKWCCWKIRFGGDIRE